MQHILFKIYKRRFSWKTSKVFDIESKGTVLNNITGVATKRLTSKDFYRLARDMDRAGIKDLRIVAIDGELYLSLNN